MFIKQNYQNHPPIYITLYKKIIKLNPSLNPIPQENGLLIINPSLDPPAKKYPFS